MHCTSLERLGLTASHVGELQQLSAASWSNSESLLQGSEVRKGALSVLQASAKPAAEASGNRVEVAGSPRRLTAKTTHTMFSCSAAKQYERLDHLASARKSVIEADLVAHLQQANLGLAAALPLEVRASI